MASMTVAAEQRKQNRFCSGRASFISLFMSWIINFLRSIHRTRFPWMVGEVLDISTVLHVVTISFSLTGGPRMPWFLGTEIILTDGLAHLLAYCWSCNSRWLMLCDRDLVVGWESSAFSLMMVGWFRRWGGRYSGADPFDRSVSIVVAAACVRA